MKRRVQMTDALGSLFLFGPGYSATVLSEMWPGMIYASARTPERAKALKATKMQAVLLADDAEVRAALTDAHLVISAPPTPEGCPALRCLAPYLDRAKSVLYLSTTGVYGDLQGGWAMEWTPVQPGSERGQRRADAEAAWTAARPDVCLVRLPGIYGPGRSALTRLKAGTARRIVKPGHVFSRIHVEDLARGLKALIEQSAVGVFNLCDGMAAPPQDVITYAAELLDLDPPPEIDFEQAALSPMAQSFYAECKRVSNAKLKAATGWRPAYPTYRSGLKAVLNADQAGT